MAMLCPRCVATELTLREQDGVAVDVCPACRGMWLDRGELERLLGQRRELEQARRNAPAFDDDSVPERDERPRKRRSKGLLEILGDILD